MKWLKRFGIIIVLLPVIFIVIGGVYETFGMCINHLATKEQTTILQNNLQKEISDIEIVTVYSKTGNTSGTGNHVDCLSSITFLTGLQKEEIENRMSKYYTLEEWDCYVDKTEEGTYMICISTSAPFVNNIEGH